MKEFTIQSPNELHHKRGNFDDLSDEESLTVARYYAKQYNSPCGGMIYNSKTDEIYHLSDCCPSLQATFKSQVGQCANEGSHTDREFMILWTQEDYEYMTEIKNGQEY